MTTLDTLGLKQLQILKYSNDPKLFMTDLLGLDCEPFHQEWLDAFENHRFVVLLAPRGHGKTTAVGSYILWRICKNRNLRCLIVTINQDKANSMMIFVQEHLAKNRKLIDLYGEFRGHSNWSRDQIRVKGIEHDIYHNEPTLKVLGVSSSIISAHYDLIVLDDITDEENSKTEYRRIELENWYNGPLIGTFMANTHVINIGTRWHEDDIHNYLSTKPGYHALRYQALIKEPDENGNGAQVLWPAHLPWDLDMLRETNKALREQGKKELEEDSLTLKLIREHQGEVYFQLQYQNNIIATGVSKFKLEWLNKSRERYSKLHILPSEMKYYMGVDIGGEDKKSDYFAATVVALDSEGDIYVVDTIRSHSSLHKQVELIKALDDKWHVSRIGLETAAQQKIIADDIIKDNPDLPIIPIKSSRASDRDTRMDRLAILFETNRILLNPDLKHLYDELAIYPRGKHDDCSDSLGFAVTASGSGGFIDYSTAKKYIEAKKTYKIYKI